MYTHEVHTRCKPEQIKKNHSNKFPSILELRNCLTAYKTLGKATLLERSNPFKFGKTGTYVIFLDSKYYRPMLNAYSPKFKVT
jgi:hypothetical protein